MSVKYPNIISQLPENLADQFAEALEESDDRFYELLVEFADEWSNDKILRVLNDQVELTKLWISQRYRLDNLEKVLTIETEEEDA